MPVDPKVYTGPSARLVAVAAILVIFLSMLL